VALAAGQVGTARAKLVWRQYRRRRLNLVALTILALLFLAAALAEQLASDKPIAARVAGETYWFPNLTQPLALRNTNLQTLRKQLDPNQGDWMIEPLIPFGPNQTYAEGEVPQEGAPPWQPGGGHPLGTDEVGRDVAARIIHGARVSLTVGFVAVGIYVLIGLLVGAIAGFYGGAVDAVLSRITEVMMTFPTFFFILAVLGLMRVKTIFPVMIVIGLTRWTDVARLVRAEVLRLKTLEFVQASRALGASDARIITRHLLPNAMGPVLVSATFGVAGAILLESGLSFLGLGVPPPTSSWGELLTQAHRYVTHPGAWWLTLYPGLAIFITITAFNLAGEGLRDALDPRLKE
jgi:peptide/nickel transport system permease protein